MNENITFAGGAFSASDLIWRLTCIGLPTIYSVPFVKEVEKWLVNSGPEWTVQRLKSLRTDLIRDMGGLEPLTYVKKNKRGSWAGVLGALFRLSNKRDGKHRKVVLAALSCYTGFRPKQPTLKHLISFRNSVEGGTDDNPDLHLCRKLGALARRTLGVLEPPKAQPLIMYQGSPGKKSPGVDASTPQNEHLEEELRCMEVFTQNRWFSEVYCRTYNPVLHGLREVDLLTDKSRLVGKTHYHEVTDFTFRRIGYHPPVVGNVVPLVKDGGWKVRWIANPFRLHQLALRPLGEALFKSLRRLPWDCTFEQDKAHKVIQDHLKSGRIAYAVDLTAATDRFPLSLQLAVLESVYPINEHVLLFRDLSRGLWRSPIGTVRWAKGQPMGLYPSFPAFALTHGLLLLHLSGTRYKKQFFVLGDDVVILDCELYKRYIHLLDKLECPVDVNKCIISNQITEFAGKIITGDTVFPKFKIGDRGSHKDSFVELCRTYGQGFRFFLPKNLRQVFEKVAHLLPPWGSDQTIAGPALSYKDKVILTDEFSELKSEHTGGSRYLSFLSFLVDNLKPVRKTSLYHRLGKSVGQLCSEFDRKREVAAQAVAIPLKTRIITSRSPRRASVPDICPFPLIHEDLTDILEVAPISKLDALPAMGLVPGKDSGQKTFYHVLKNMLKKQRELTSKNDAVS
jgi:hypothetical protein